ncbi:MAG: PhoH family protein, partial [Cellulomonadaceae bacterium]|nr:PhoH family protein [Cellulomonadaceae bacterium]
MTATPTPLTGDHHAVVEHRIVVPAHLPAVALLGPGDEVLRAVEGGFPSVRIHARGDEITLVGPPAEVELVARLLDELLEVAVSGTHLSADVVTRSVQMLTAATASRPAEVLTQNILSSRGRTIRPKTVGQKAYVDAIDRNTITFGIGPAGTG